MHVKKVKLKATVTEALLLVDRSLAREAVETPFKVSRTRHGPPRHFAICHVRTASIAIVLEP